MEARLTCADVRQMDLVYYLEALGYHPQKIRGAEYWYLSPLRTERTASFKVDRRLNCWYDHGTGQGGSLIDFGILYYRCSVGELLFRLSRDVGSARLEHPPLSFSALPPRPKAGKIKIISAGAITSEALVRYLAARRIDLALAQRYCCEVSFSLYGKQQVALGFANNRGGYELRNAAFKGSSAPKDYTLVDHGSSRLRVFEGFFSFLSYLQLCGVKNETQTNFLVLNSLALLGRGMDLMEQHRRVYLYLDRDEAGTAATRNLLAAGLRYTDKSGFYRGYTDPNELLVQGGKGPTKVLRTKRRR